MLNSSRSGRGSRVEIGSSLPDAKPLDSASSASPARREIRVLFTFRSVDGNQNPFTRELLESVERSGPVTGISFSWGQALYGRYDLIHLHWPESLTRSHSLPKAIVKPLLAAALAARIWASGTPVVATVHNREPHERGSRLERVVLRLFDKLVTFRVYLNESAENDYADGIAILHGRYQVATRADEGNRKGAVGNGSRPIYVLFFGLLRPYKGLESLVTAFRGLKEPELSLVIAGRPNGPRYAASLTRTLGGDGRITLRAGHLPDDELADLIDGSGLVVLPYRYMYNSGAAILALSHRKHVLVPKAGATEELQTEVGDEWVSLFVPPIDPQDIRAALAKARISTSLAGGPDLTRRDWDVIGLLHTKLYEGLVSERKATRNRARQARSLRARISEDPEFLRHSKRNG